MQKMSGILIYYPLPPEHQMSLAKRSIAVSSTACAFQESINFYSQCSWGKYRDTFLRSRDSNRAEREWCALHGNPYFLIHLSLENQEFITFLSITEKKTGYFGELNTSSCLLPVLPGNKKQPSQANSQTLLLALRYL